MKFGLITCNFAVMIVEISQPQRCDKHGKKPAKKHGEELYDKEDKGIAEKSITTHDETNDVFIDKARVRVQKSADSNKKYLARRKSFISLG